MPSQATTDLVERSRNRKVTQTPSHGSEGLLGRLVSKGIVGCGVTKGLDVEWRKTEPPCPAHTATAPCLAPTHPVAAASPTRRERSDCTTGGCGQRAQDQPQPPVPGSAPRSLDHGNSGRLPRRSGWKGKGTWRRSWRSAGRVWLLGWRCWPSPRGWHGTSGEREGDHPERRDAPPGFGSRGGVMGVGATLSDNRR